jgi:pyridinium-3,5-bisthiocarboxylic acid mononucleotide nickel chelatase
LLSTLEILSGRKVYFLEEPLEITTPTGATIVKYYAKDNAKAPPFRIEKIGYGAGSYKSARPDVLRIFIGERDAPSQEEEVWVIESDIDDMDMEYVGAVADQIRQAGALDVLYFPVYMKKGRMGIRLSVSTNMEHLENILDKLFLETTTFGIRIRKDQRRVLRREENTVETSLGKVRLKRGYDDKGNLLKTHIEFEDVKRLSEEKGIPYRTMLVALKKEVEA